MINPPEAENRGAWGPARRVLFRFGFAYLLLYNLPFPFEWIPGLGFVVGPYMQLWQTIVAWVGKRVFGLTITVFTNGSGDTTFNYLQVLCYAVLAVAAALVWSLVDRRRRADPRLAEWLRVYVRFSLATAMIVYGAYKVFPSQFPSPSLDRLIQPFGDASPMGMLWTFMGASAAYTSFTGMAEMLGGLLLTLRRTTLLGSLVSIGVLANVVMLNMSYDVPVKLYSLHLFALAVFVAAPDFRRLADLFVLNRPVEPAASRPLFTHKWLHRGALALRTVFVLYVAGLTLYQSRQSLRQPKSPLYGIWEVDELHLDGQLRPPLVTDELRWRRVVFDYPRMIGFQQMSGTRQRYFLELDPVKKTLALTKRDDPEWKTTLSYRRDGDRLTIAGPFDGRKVQARLRLAPADEFLLTSRGFHWINEYPFQR